MSELKTFLSHDQSTAPKFSSGTDFFFLYFFYQPHNARHPNTPDLSTPFLWRAESNPLNFFGVLFFRTFLFSPHRFISFSILFPRTDLIFLRHLHRKKIYRKFGIEFHMFLHASHFHHLNSALGLETTFSQLSKFKLNGWNFYRKRFSIRAFNRGYNFLASLCHHTV